MINCHKPTFHFVQGYRKYLDIQAPTRHLMTTCFSEFNRYPAQTEFIRNMMSVKRNGALKILNIGVAQGQEPLTHIKSAFELSQASSKTISDFLDLKVVDILSTPPELPKEAKSLNNAVVNHLMNIYDTRSGKSFWSTPIEQFVDSLLQKGEKQDVILFNNVLQHMSTKNEQNLPKIFDKLTDLVAENGIFCFASIGTFIFSPITEKRYNSMLKILKSKNFIEIGENSGIYKKLKN